MGFVHLHDMLVMFPPAYCAAMPESSQIRITAWECWEPAGVQMSGPWYRIGHWKSGEMHEQIRDQAFDAGNVFNGVGHRALGHQGVRRARQRRASAILEQVQEEKDQRSHAHHPGRGIRQGLSRRLCLDL